MSLARRSLLLAAVSLTAVAIADKASAAYIPFGRYAFVATDYNVLGDGVTNDAAAINAFLTTCSNAGAVAYFPGGKTYICGSTQLVVPDGLTVTCGQNATFTRSADQSGATPYGDQTGPLVTLGNHCRWAGGVLNNTAVSTTSTTSIASGTGSKTFTVGSGLPYTTSTFLRIQSRSNPAIHMEGLVTSYSGTTLTVNVSFTGPTSGTKTDWNIMFANVFQSPMVLHGVTQTLVENVRVTGNWYVGLMFEGWNPSTGGSLATTNCTFRNCWAESVQNRSFYQYGNASDNVFDNCFALGVSGTTDYAFNLNCANATGSVNSQQRTRIINCSAIGHGFQGFEVGDQCLYTTIDSCTAAGMVSATGSAAFLVQKANGISPQYTHINNCIAHSCAGVGFLYTGTLYGGATRCSAVACNIGFEITSSGGTASSYISLNGCEADSSTTIGFWVTGSAVDCDLNSLKAISNTTNGVQIDAGCNNIIANGRAVGNGTNVVDNGTGTVKSITVV